VIESPVAVFEKLVRLDLAEHKPVVFGTVCVLGGSVAGLLAARVLADHAREVVIVERDEVDLLGRPRTGVPQDRHGHVLLPGGLTQIERWLPGIAKEAHALGAYLAGPEQQVVYHDGEPKVRGGNEQFLLASRPFLEARIRSRVLALPNVSTLAAQASGLVFTNDRVSGVRYTGDGVLAADFVVDAMGRASKLSDWLEQTGYERPRLQRVKTGISYATALFERTEKADELNPACVLELFSPDAAPDDLTVAHTSVIEDDQWLVMLMAYGEPAKSIVAFRSTCAKLPPVFTQASSGAVTHGIETYHQADSRRRDFTGLSHFPAGVVAVGDAAASFNPIYGQGLSSAALHASCLSEYLTSDPDLAVQAADFFALQEVVVDAAWAISAGGDAARQDRLAGNVVPEDVQRQRWAMHQIVEASIRDETIGAAFDAVTYMLAHPATLADPALLDRAIRINQNT
jgi:2-polyprenyl-6-methoxyphenol hydroxylase-like FAD-dependent oxidoreductase